MVDNDADVKDERKRGVPWDVRECGREFEVRMWAGDQHKFGGFSLSVFSLFLRLGFILVGSQSYRQMNGPHMLFRNAGKLYYTQRGYGSQSL